MKRVRFSIVILLVMLMLGGCSKTIELTDEETDMFAEYISKEVLERDKYYDQELLAQEYNEDEEEEDEKESTTSASASQGATNVGYVSSQTSTPKQLTESTVDAILGTSSVSVSYDSAKVYDSYPEGGNNYFVISSSNGYQLLVVTFDLKNTSKKDTTYSMLSSDVSYTLTMENGSTYKPLLTLLVDDLQFVDKVISTNKTEEGVLVFRISENEVKSKGTLQIVSDTKSTTLEIK